MSNKSKHRDNRLSAETASDRTKGTEEARNDLYIVPAVDRAVRLLELLAHEKGELSLAEMTFRLRLPHATVFRLTHTLELHGLLRRSPTGYEIGPRILTLGFEYLSSLDIVTVARAELNSLRDATGASTNLGILDRCDILYVCHVPSLRPLGSRIQVGTRLPAHGSSIGRVLLSALSIDELKARYHDSNIEELPDSVNTLPAIIAQAVDDRMRGWVLKHGLFERDLIAIAAPIFDVSATVVAAINISGPASVMGPPMAERLTERLLLSAHSISRQLGYAG